MVEVGAMTEEYLPGYREALDVVARERRYFAFTQAPSLDEVKQFVGARGAGENPRIVAHASGTVIGWWDIARVAIESLSHRGNLGIGVVPAYRGVGVGRKLLARAISDAWRVGMTRIELSVFADNRAAIASYTAFDFVQEGTMRGAARIDGRYLDAISMCLLRSDVFSD